MFQSVQAATTCAPDAPASLTNSVQLAIPHGRSQSVAVPAYPCAYYTLIVCVSSRLSRGKKSSPQNLVCFCFCEPPYGRYRTSSPCHTVHCTCRRCHHDHAKHTKRDALVTSSMRGRFGTCSHPATAEANGSATSASREDRFGMRSSSPAEEPVKESHGDNERRDSPNIIP